MIGIGAERNFTPTSFFVSISLAVFLVNGDDGWQGSAGQHTYCVPSTQTPRCKPEKQKTTNTFIYYQTLLLTINHFKRMKKNFLLLLLLTLLPLAGWATDYEVQVTTFNGTAIWTGTKPAVQPGWFTAVPTSGTLSNEQKNFIASKLQVKDITENPNYDAGSWNYQLELSGDQVVSDGDNNYTIFVNSSTTATLTITKFTGEVAFDAASLAFVNDELVYTSQPQALLSGGATATANGFTVPVVYATSETAENWVAWENLKETNANTGYNVYYKVVGTDNYAGSEVKTMAGTKPIAKATITFNLSAAPGLTYNGAPQALLALTDNTKPATNFGASTLQYKIDDAGEWAELPEAGIAGITGTSAKNGVAYSINLKVPADGNGNWDATEIAAPIETTIAKATPIFTYVPTHENGGLPSGLGYDGQPHQLVLQEATAIVENTEISVPLKYSIRRYKNVSKGYTTRSVKPFNELVGTLASTQYQIRAYNEATDDLNQAIQSLENVKIDKATIPAEAYTEPVEKNVRTTGAAQDLVDAATWTGETTYGTFQYSLTNNGTDWSTDVPQGTDVAEYTVYWRIYPTVTSGTQNYNIVSSNYASNIIGKSKVTVTTAANQSFGYGTTPVIEKTVAWEEQGEDALNEEALAWKWYTDEACSTPAVANASGYYTVGDYYVKASGLAVTGTTAASQEIVYVPALVKITAGQVNATISGTATYGSLPTFTLTHTSGLSETEAENFNATNNLSKVTIKKDGAVVNELANVAKNDANLATLAAGEYDLEATASCGDSYTVIVSAGKLTVNPNAEYVFAIADITAVDYKAAKWEPEVTVTGLTAGTDYTVSYGDDTHDNINAGTGIVKITGIGNYDGATGSKTFTINKADLTITADNFTGEKAWTYGTVEPTYTATVTGYLDGESFGGTLAGINGTLKVKRTSNETVGMHTGALVAGFYDADDNKIAAPEATNYNLAFNPGDLQVAKGAVVIQLKEAVIATYGDDPATSINAAIKNIANYEYVSGLSELEAANFASFIDVAAATFELTETKPQVGTDYTFAIDGATSTNYGVTINPGTYNVTAADITLYANDQAINWADTDPDNDAADTEVKATTVTIADGELKYTDALKDVVASIVIASQNVGTNNISLTAAENANYNIFVNSDGTNAKYGVLTVTGAPALALSTADPDLADKLASYNGKSMPVTIDFSSRNGRNLGGARNWGQYDWMTLTLPFDISVADLSKALGYAIVNVIDDSRTVVNGTSSEFYGKLTMTGGNGYVDPTDPDNDAKKDTKLAANKPFLVKTADDINGVVDFGTQTIVAPASPADLTVDAGLGATFVGTYAPYEVTSGDKAKKWFMIGGGYGKWARIGTSSVATWELQPTEAYIQLPVETQSIIFNFEDVDGNTTAIKSIDVDNLSGKVSAEGWYTLNGVKLQGAPTEKGVYIKDGKKVVIK